MIFGDANMEKNSAVVCAVCAAVMAALTVLNLVLNGRAMKAARSSGARPKERRKISMMSAVIVAACALSLAAVVVYARASAKSRALPAGARGGRKEASVSVKTQEARVETLHDYVSANGDVMSVNSVAVYPNMGGKIAGVNVSLGSRVAKGSLLLYVDPSEPGSNFSLSPVYAPIGGSVVSTPLKVGTQVTPSTAVTTIGDISNLQVTAYIPERHVAALKENLKAEISFEAYPDALFAATVSRVSPVVDAASRAKEILLLFDEKDPRLNAGMFGKVKLYTYDYGGAVVVPMDAIVDKNDSRCLYVVGGEGCAERREITEGRTVDAMTQILSGVEPGESVVVEGGRALSDGAKVTVIGERAKGRESPGGKREANEGAGEGARGRGKKE